MMYQKHSSFLRTALLVCMCGLFVQHAAGAVQQYVVRLKSTSNVRTIGKLALRDAIMPAPSSIVKPTDRVLSADQTTKLDALKRFRTVVVSSEADLAALLASKEVESVSINHIFTLDQVKTTDDSLSDKQYALRILNAKDAWKIATGKGVQLAVVDTGIDWMHPDLMTSLAVSPQEDINNNGRFDAWPSNREVDGVTGDLNGKDDDGNGYIDDVIGFDLVDQSTGNVGDDSDRDPAPFDEHGHGTSVAGVVAAIPNNVIGVAGLAYNTKIITARAFDALGNAEEDDIAAAIVYAALRGARIINMSFGDGVDSPVMKAALDFAESMGCVLISSCGNTGAVSRQYPASYSSVFAVAATTSNDVQAPFSSIGSIVDVAAPGEAIVTTAVNSRYRTVSGTSFSAPYVAAAVALLLERHPQLNAAEVRMLLAESSVDLGEKGWDPIYGNGRLDVLTMLTMPASAEMRIDAPAFDAQLTISKGSTVDVTGTATAVLFDHYEVSIGSGIEPTSWKAIGTGNQVKNGLLATWNTDTAKSGDYVVRLSLVLKSGRWIETRHRVQLYDNLPLQFSKAILEQAWQDDRRVGVLTVALSRPASLYVEAYVNGSDSAITVADYKHRARQHSVHIGMVNPGETVKIIAHGITMEGLESIYKDSIVITDAAMPTLGWDTVSYTLPAAYPVNKVRPLYDGGNPCVVLNDLSNGSFGSLKVYEFDKTRFTARDSMSAVWIPRDIGDVNSDGIADILCQVVGKSILFTSANGIPFGKVLWGDTVTGEWNAARLADVDGDGVDDIVMIGDEGVKVVTCKSGVYSTLATAVNPSNPGQGSANNRVDEISAAVADFDGDGRTEIAFGDTDGDITIVEYSNGNLRTEYTANSDGMGGSGYVIDLDIDGDGKKEVAYAVPDDVLPSANGDYGRQVWTLTILKSSQVNKYDVMYQDRFTGVRYGIGYRSGLSSGDLVDNAAFGKADELVVSVYPRVYVFGYDRPSSSIQPVWYNDGVVSSRSVIYDFDGSGRPTLGLGKSLDASGYMTDMVFYRAPVRTTIAAPTGVRAVFEGGSRVRISWAGVAGASRYIVYRATNTATNFVEYMRTSDRSVVTPPMPSNVAWAFVVQAVAEDTSVRSSFSADCVLYSYDAGTLIAVAPNVIDSSAARNGTVVTCRYSSVLSEKGTQYVSAYMTNGDDTVTANAIVLGGDSTLVLGFPRHTFSAERYVLHITGVRDLQEKLLDSARFDIRVEAKPIIPEVILSRLRVNNRKSITLWFDRPVTKASASTIANYILTPALTVTGIESDGSDSITIAFDGSPSPAALGFSYTIHVENVVAEDGSPMTKGPGSTLGFVVAESSLDSIGVYPHPASLTNDDFVVFSGLVPEARIDVLDQRMNLVVSVKEYDGNGGARWNLSTDNGEKVPPGLYFYRVYGEGVVADIESSGLGKLWIKR